MTKNFLILSMLAISLTAAAQVNPDTIQRRVIRHMQEYPQEKIYLHLDRPHYSPGDTIWFKAYITDAVSHMPDSVSKNIYVELIRKNKGKQVQTLMLKNNGGFTNGNIALKDTLSEGVYEIRAFTNWMRNFSEDQFFHKEVYLRKKYEFKNSFNIEELNLLQVADLQFFPEGGNLVAGLQNRVAFKAVNRLGKGVDFAAFIISEHNDTVTTVQSKHLGMGSFIFIPKSGERYYARIDKSSTGHSPLQKLFYLPQPQTQGYTLFVDNLSNKDAIRVIARNNFPVKDRPILIGHSRGNVVFGFQSGAEGNSFSWSLKKVEIPDDGVVQLTLFNSAGEPQSERLIYNDTKTPLAISINSDKAEYQPHEKVTLNINVKDVEGNPVKGNFSLAVTDEQQVNPEKNGENIFSYLYLSSDVQSLSQQVKGVIEQPSYYFDKSNVNAPVHLDILLMTQGWRRFLWKDVITPSIVTKQDFEIETGYDIHGTAKLSTGKKLKDPLKITMMYPPEPGGLKQFSTATTDLDGKFSFTDLNVKATTTAFIQATKDNGSRWTIIDINEYKWPVFTPVYEVADPFYSDPETMKAFVDRQKHYAELEAELKQTDTKMLKEVVVTARVEKKTDSRKTLYEGTNSQTVVVSKESCGTASHVLQLLQGKVAGLQVNSTGAGFTAMVRSPRSFTGSSAPTYLVDGMVTDASFLNAILPCSVESIDVITHPVSIYNAQGLVSILTKRGDPNYNWSAEDARGALVAKLKGYDVAREFYSPKYPLGDESTGKQKPDFRATLYWNPMIKTDAQGSAKITFWNSDEKTTIRAVFEGISSDGTPGAASYGYKVE